MAGSCHELSRELRTNRVLPSSPGHFHELEVEETMDSSEEIQEDCCMYEDITPYCKAAERRKCKSSFKSTDKSEQMLYCYENESDTLTRMMPCKLSDPWHTPRKKRHSSTSRRPLASVTDDRDWYLSYAADLYQHKRQKELELHAVDCLALQPQVSAGMRAVLIGWLGRLLEQFQFYRETLFLTVNIIDRFLVTTAISSDCFQLLGITAFLIAGKYEEICPPAIDELLRLSCNAYTRDQVRQLEQIMLSKISFNLTAPTSHFFLEYYSASRMAEVQRLDCTVEQIRQSRALAFYILEMGLQDYELCQFLPSTLAIAALLVADQTHAHNTCPSYLLSVASKEDLANCIEDLRQLTSQSWECMEDVFAICNKYWDA